MDSLDIQQLKEGIGQKRFRLRTEKGLSTRKLAVLADMEHHQILAIEKGMTDVRLSTLVKLCCALEITLVDLFSL